MVQSPHGEWLGTQKKCLAAYTTELLRVRSAICHGFPFSLFVHDPRSIPSAPFHSPFDIPPDTRSLAGTFGIMLMMFIVGITLGIRQLVRWRREGEGYEMLESEKDSEAVLFDADQHYYNHHATTTRTE